MKRTHHSPRNKQACPPGRAVFWLCLWWSLVCLTNRVLALDPPHNDANACDNCHILHNAQDLNLAVLSGNANLCQSCHQSGGPATAKALPASDQAVTWPGLPAGTNATGSSHRWDSSVSGRVVSLGGTSTGTILAGGLYTGVYPKTYTLTIATAGNAGAATFNWTATSPGGGSGTAVLTGSNVALDSGTTASFINGTGVSFQTGDRWNIFVRPGLNQPTDTNLLVRMTNGLIACSTCHNPHDQSLAPFDPAAPAYTVSGTGAGRHYMRIANDTEQLCAQCHASRNVTSATAGSHPVGVTVTSGTGYKAPTTVPLEKGTSKIRCETCHKVHFAGTSDGSLNRLGSINAVCTDCHTLADTTSPAAHLDPASGVLWPGGQNGSTFPTNTVVSQKGACINCHQPHGWPNAASPGSDYPQLLVETADNNLCFTCHDTDGPAAKVVQADFAKTIHHPVATAEQRPGREVACVDCHNPHQAQANAHTYSSTSRTITGAANNGSGLIRITSTAHGFVNNDTVLIASVGGVTAANGTRRITGVTANTFDLLGSTFSGTYTSGGTAIIVANTNRNLASNPLKGVSGVAVNYSAQSNYQTVAPSLYTAVPATTGATNEYQVCFKCHTGYGFPNYTTGTATFTQSSTAVTGSGTAWTADLLGATILRTGDTVGYTITAVPSATSLTLGSAYAGATQAGQSYAIWNPPAGLSPLYNTGTATFTQNSTTVTGSGTTWYNVFVGAWIVNAANPQAVYKITAVASTTSLTIYPAYAGTTAAGQTYAISGETDVAQEFSPKNGSFHPVVAGLTSTGSGSSALTSDQMKAPWASNLGSQTMMCSDCHNTDSASPAAQGPHGSAAQFMLRGPNTLWPPTVRFNSGTSLSTAYGTSFCANCHTYTSSNLPHNKHGTRSLYCYSCHILIPHGGKLGRLIGDGRSTSGMPARYAFNNNKTNLYITGFTKGSTPGGYSESNCGATCDTSKHPTANGTKW